MSQRRPLTQPHFGEPQAHRHGFGSVSSFFSNSRACRVTPGNAAGIHLVAVAALVAGVAPCVPGCLGTTKLMDVKSTWLELYQYAWFLSFGVSAVVYVALAWPVRAR